MQQKKSYEEQMLHRTDELPIALHQLEYPEGTDILFFLHWHKEFEFLVVTKGAIEMTIEERSYLLQAGDCIFINSNLYHSAKSIERNSCGFYAIDFSYEFLHEDLYTNFGRKYIRPVMEGKMILPELIRTSEIPDTSWQNQVIQDLNDINCCGEKHLMSHELMIKSRIFFIWEALYNHAVFVNSENEKASTQKNLIKPVLQYIKKNYSEEITLLTLADLIPMSEGQFCRVFKQAMKVTPFQYLMNYRIIQSCHLLVESDKKIAEIANLTGFNNISYFNKVFLKIIGCTPKQYREAYFDPDNAY